MGACIAVAEQPGVIENIFLNRGVSEAGAYALQFYALNVPITITVDDRLPVTNYGNSINPYYRTLYAYIGDDNSIWGSIMEKAWGKFNGNYARLVGGDTVDGIMTLTGAPYEKYSHINSADDIYDWIRLHKDKKGMLAAGTPCSGVTYSNQGIV
jgi:calpain-15